MKKPNIPAKHSSLKLWFGVLCGIGTGLFTAQFTNGVSKAMKKHDCNAVVGTAYHVSTPKSGAWGQLGKMAAPLVLFQAVSWTACARTRRKQRKAAKGMQETASM